jgi:hypothetical protein
MHRHIPKLLSIVSLLLLAACSDDAETVRPLATGGGGAGGAGGAGGSGGSGGAEPAEPISAPKEQWTWVPFDNAFCANGTTTGLGVNLSDKSDRVLLFVEGGGACWSEVTCYTLKKALYFDSEYSEETFSKAIAGYTRDSGNFFDRTAETNPFKDYSYVFVPYCTGDVHSGDNVVKYGDKTAMHVGARNMAAFLARLAPTFPSAERVILAGTSAGGFGALANWRRVQDAFGATRVDLLDDSGIPIEGASGQQAAQATQWNLKANFPPGCTECEAGLPNIIGYYGRTFPDHRAAFVSFTTDTVLPAYNGTSPAQFTEAFNSVLQAQVEPNPNMRYFLFEGSGHVLWLDPTVTTNSISLRQWVAQMVSDDPDWANQRP